MKGLSGLVHVGLDILHTSVDATTGKILAQTGDVTKEATDTDGLEWWQQVGFSSRPSNPIAGVSAAQAVVLKTSDRDVCIASQDTRCLDRYALLKAGETCVFAAGENGTSQARSLWKTDGSITHYTTDTNAAGGKSVYARVAKGTNDLGAPDGFSWIAPWGTTKFDGTGFHTVHLSGAEFHLGGIYGMPAPLDQIASYCKIAAGTIHLECSALSVGLVGCTPLALQIPTLAMFTALQTEIAALQIQSAAIATYLGVLTSDPSHVAPATVTAQGAMTAAIGVGAAAVVAGAAALAAQALLMPATTSST